MFTPEQIAALEAPLNKANVKTRKQANIELSYVEAWHAIAEANRIFGFDAWNRETVDLRQLGDVRTVNNKFRVGYSARVRITVHTDGRTIVREGCGFGSGIDNDADQAHESALKEAESDAMKRALMTFGNPFGLALYDKTQANVVVEPHPRSAAVVAGEASLIMCRTAADFDEWGSKNKSALENMTPEDRAHLVAMWKRGKADAAKSDPFAQEAA
uniref:Putative Rad52/22 double-strand break repair protein n=1 Tax=viral metagenome TaxID=1070528 RepID=A0A6M3LL51_9ZZZZ